MSGKFVDSLFSFLADPEGLTQKEICSDLKKLGISPRKLKKRMKRIIKESKKRRKR